RAAPQVQDTALRGAGNDVVPPVAANRLFAREDTLLDRGTRHLAIRDCRTNNSCVNRTDSYRRVPSMATPLVARTPGAGRGPSACTVTPGLRPRSAARPAG